MVIHLIKARFTTYRVIELLGNIDKLVTHSNFQTGINYKYKNELIFIGSGKNGVLPFGIHINDFDIPKLIKSSTSIFEIDIKNLQLLSDDIIIDLKDSTRINSKLPSKISCIDKKYLDVLLESIIDFNIKTGLDVTIQNLIDEHNEIGNLIYNLLTTADNKKIRNNLLNIIGRGCGLTPSGDDLLIGLIWLNDIIDIFSDVLKENLIDLILNYKLTTDISMNYYKSALSGHYSSRLITLFDGLYRFNIEKIHSSLQDIIKWGHTSGIDTLAGVALGLNYVNNIKTYPSNN